MATLFTTNKVKPQRFVSAISKFLLKMNGKQSSSHHFNLPAFEKTRLCTSDDVADLKIDFYTQTTCCHLRKKVAVTCY